MSLKKSIVFTVSVFSIVMAVALASAAKDERSYPLQQILGAKVLDGQSLVLSAATVYPNTCIAPVRTLADLDSERREIRLHHYIQEKDQLCLQRIVPVRVVAEVVLADKGLYTIIDGSSGERLAELESK